MERLIDAARAHGEQSDPDHEVGDLQGILRDCWAVMTPEQRKEVYDLHEDNVADWVPEETTAPDVHLNLDAIADAVIATRKRRI